MAKGVAGRARTAGRRRLANVALPSDGRLRESAGRVARDRLEGVLPSSAYPAPPWAAAQADPDYGRSAAPSWRDIDWTRHLHDVEVAGRRIRYVDLGGSDAPPVVFVHGLGGNWQNWLENLPRIARRRRVLALDLPGFGASEPPDEDISVPGYADTMDAWLDRLGIGRVAVVGNSMGGFIAAELAIRHAERVERLALVAAAGISQTNLKRRPTMTVARLSAVIGALTASRSRLIVSRPRLRHVVVSPVIRHPTRMEADLLWEVMQGGGKPGYQEALEALIDYDFRDRLGEISAPCLIVWGRDDVIVPVRDGQVYERLIPHSRQVVMEDTGHVPMLERPDAFNDELERFLAEEAPPTGRKRPVSR